MLEGRRSSGGKVGRPIPTNDGGLPDDAQFDHKCTGWRDQATHRALYLLDESQHRPDVAVSADVPRLVQEDLAVSHVGRRIRYPALAGVDRRGDFGGESVLLLNVRAS